MKLAAKLEDLTKHYVLKSETVSAARCFVRCSRGRLCGDYGAVRLWKEYASESVGMSGPANLRCDVSGRRKCRQNERQSAFVHASHADRIRLSVV